VAKPVAAKAPAAPASGAKANAVVAAVAPSRNPPQTAAAPATVAVAKPTPIKSFPGPAHRDGAKAAKPVAARATPPRRGGRETQRVGEARESVPTAARSPFSKDFLEKQRAKLLVKKEEILAMYKKDLKSGQESNDSPTEDIVDRANNAYSRELAFSISDNERELMLQIDQAIARVDAGSYGYCLHTGQPIGLARLEAIPWAKYGVEAQEMLEKGLLSEA
jgi:DnaK suppressor protein